MKDNKIVYSHDGRYRCVKEGIGPDSKQRQIEIGYVKHDNPENDQMKLIIRESVDNKEKTITIYNEGIVEMLNIVLMWYSHVKNDSKNDDDSNYDADILELILNNKQLMKKVVESGLSENNMLDAIRYSYREKELKEFESMLSQRNNEHDWQSWISDHRWILGSPYANILERNIDLKTQVDFFVHSIDGYVDIVEIKRPDMKLFTHDNNHDNYYPSKDLSLALSQCMKYTNHLEIQQDSNTFTERVGSVLKPRCILIAGLENELSEREQKQLRILNSTLHGITITPYDTLLRNAKSMIKFDSDQLSKPGKT